MHRKKHTIVVNLFGHSFHEFTAQAQTTLACGNATRTLEGQLFGDYSRRPFKAVSNLQY